MEALYLKIPRDVGYAEDSLQSLLGLVQEGPARDWSAVCGLLSHCIEAYEPTASLDPFVVEQLADLHVYVELDDSDGGNRFRCRPTIQRLKRDAQKGRFRRLLVSSVPSLGRDIREVVSVVCALLDLGITIVPTQFDSACIDPGMGKALRLVESWCAEIAREKRSAAIKAGQSKVRARGKSVGRPKRVFDREEVVRLREDEHLSWSQVAQALGIGVGTARRAYAAQTISPGPAKSIQEVA